MGMLLLQAKKESPLTTVRGEIVFHGTTLIYPARAIPDISCHPVTGMNRPAPRRLLQSGVPSPLRRGLSLSPLAEGRCDTADFVIAFVDLKFIIDAFRHLSRGNLPHFLQVLPLFPSACHHKRAQEATDLPASCAFFKVSPLRASVIPQGVDGVQLCRLVGRQIAEQDADAHADAEADGNVRQGRHGAE